jgi:hypothetical protein
VNEEGFPFVPPVFTPPAAPPAPTVTVYVVPEIKYVEAVK